MVGSVRGVLAAIVADPELGPAVLADPGRMASLLGDYLPDSPAERAVLLAAVSAGVPGLLMDRSDMPPAGVMRLAATAMSERTGYPPATAEWAAREFAVALGLAAPAPTEVAGTPAPPVPFSVPPPLPPKRRRRPLAVVAGCAVIVAAGGYAVVVLTHSPAGTPGTSSPPAGSSPATPASSAPGSSPPVSLADFKVCTDPANYCNAGLGMRTQPVRIVTSGDGSAYLDRLTWAGWGSPTARAVGVDEVNDCVPSCASGTFTGYPATVKLTDLTRYGNDGLQGYGTIIISTPAAPYSTGERFTAFPARPGYSVVTRPTPPPVNVPGVTSIAGGYLVNCSTAQCTVVHGAGPDGTSCDPPKGGVQFCPASTAGG
jgi:hypothetical protein